jgi:putative membrane protein
MFADDWDPDRMMNGRYDGDGMMYGGAWLMLGLGLVVVALLVAMLVLMVRMSAGAPPVGAARPSGPVATPRELLDLRLARGEISPEDYRATRPLLDP